MLVKNLAIWLVLYLPVFITGVVHNMLIHPLLPLLPFVIMRYPHRITGNWLKFCVELRHSWRPNKDLIPCNVIECTQPAVIRIKYNVTRANREYRESELHKTSLCKRHFHRIQEDPSYFIAFKELI